MLIGLTIIKVMCQWYLLPI